MVVGGAGLIGSHVVDQLIETDVGEIIIYDNFVRGRHENIETALLDPRVTFFAPGRRYSANRYSRGCILRRSRRVSSGGALAAAVPGLSTFCVRRDVHGTFNVFEAAVSAGVERLVYSSSASVYGDALSEPMTEEHPFNNKNFYGATKIAGEAMARAFHHQHGLDLVGLRYMNVYGPRQDYRGAYIAVIMKMLDAIDRGEAPTVMGDGSEAFDFVAVEDCARANICAMRAEAVDRFYNVGTGRRTSLKELAEMIRQLTGCRNEIAYAPRRASTLVRNRIGCPKLAAEEIDFRARIDLSDGLEKLIAWRAAHKASLQANPCR